MIKRQMKHSMRREPEAMRTRTHRRKKKVGNDK
jgi:hypothetical protein